MKVHENNNPTHDLEIAVVVFALRIWHHYLYGIHVDILTDHKRLQYVFTLKELNLRQKRWLELHNHYEMSILYHLGNTNEVVDALRRLSMGVPTVLIKKRGSYPNICTHFYTLESNLWIPQMEK